MKTFVDWLNALALSMDGTCTGEHGIGQGKKSYLQAEMGHAVDVMSTISAAGGMIAIVTEEEDKGGG